MARPQGPNESTKRLQRHYVILIIVVLTLVGVAFWATQRTQSPEATSTTLQISSSSVTQIALSATNAVSSTASMFTEAPNSTVAPLVQPSDFNNVSYSGCVTKGPTHTYLNLNLTITNRLDATVDYVNVSIIYQSSQISNGFHTSSNYTQEVSGPSNMSVLRLSLSLPIDNVVSGSLRVEAFIRGVSGQVEVVILQPNISLAPSEYQQCAG